MHANNKQAKRLAKVLLVAAIVACLLAEEALAGGKGNKGGGDDIILYNGNIVLRGSGGKGKGKGGGGSIVVANSPSHGSHESAEMPFGFDWMGGGGDFGRRK